MEDDDCDDDAEEHDSLEEEWYLLPFGLRVRPLACCDAGGDGLYALELLFAADAAAVVVVDGPFMGRRLGGEGGGLKSVSVS